MKKAAGERHDGLSMVQSNYTSGSHASLLVDLPRHDDIFDSGDDGIMSDSHIPTIEVQGLAHPLPAATPVLDVREPHEWAAGHIEGAIHIPLGELPSRLDELDPQKPTLVICHLGGRSARATQWLQTQGFDATNVAGGMDAWEAAGRPITR